MLMLHYTLVERSLSLVMSHTIVLLQLKYIWVKADCLFTQKNGCDGTIFKGHAVNRSHTPQQEDMKLRHTGIFMEIRLKSGYWPCSCVAPVWGVAPRLCLCCTVCVPCFLKHLAICLQFECSGRSHVTYTVCFVFTAHCCFPCQSWRALILHSLLRELLTPQLLLAISHFPWCSKFVLGYWWFDIWCAGNVEWSAFLTEHHKSISPLDLEQHPFQCPLLHIVHNPLLMVLHRFTWLVWLCFTTLVTCQWASILLCGLVPQREYNVMPRTTVQIFTDRAVRLSCC